MDKNDCSQHKKELKYSDFVDLNGCHDEKFTFTVKVTWDKYNDPEYILFNINKVVARDKWDAEQKAKDLFTNEIMGGDKAERKYLKAYVIDYLNAPKFKNKNNG